MKIITTICSILTVGLLAGGLTACISATEKQARLEAKAKITRADAEKTALAKVPGGKVMSAELEAERGKLLWSFDISTPNAKDITEVHMDAISGAVLSVAKELRKTRRRSRRARRLAHITGLKPFVLGADKYNIAAELSFYTREPENQINHLAYGNKGFGFRYWTPMGLFEGRPAVAVLPKLNQNSLSGLDHHFDRIDPPNRLDIPTVGARTRTMWLIDCYGYRVKPHLAHRALRSTSDSRLHDSKE